MSDYEREKKTTAAGADNLDDEILFASARNSLDELRRLQHEQQQQHQQLQQSETDCSGGTSTNDDDLSQSSESAKCLSSSDLESCSVSSIRKINDFTMAENDFNNVDMSSRRVSFPKKDSDLVTGYLEPANPWKSAVLVRTSTELTELYRHSCLKHKTTPLGSVIDHLQSLELDKTARSGCLNLKESYLTPESCEALEEILKRVQYQAIDLTACNLNDAAASALFDMIEYYEAANEVNISENPNISSSGWQSCVSMIRKSHTLQTITIRGNAISELCAANLGKALNHSNLNTIKLEHCGLTGRPLASLCNALRKNTTLRELWLAYNDLHCPDAEKLAELLKVNAHLQFLDVSNNNLKDAGVKSIAIALIEQAESLSFAAKLLESREKLKLDSVMNACANITNDTTAIEIPLEDTAETSQRSEDSTTRNDSSSRSMLDALLQMKPGECLEPVQSPGNNNDSKETIEATIADGDENCLSPNNEVDSTAVDRLGDLADSTSNELEIIETNNENATNNTTDTNLALDQHEKEKMLLTNNNTVENTKTDLEDDASIEIIKKLDLNENKEEENGCELFSFDTTDDELNQSIDESPSNISAQLNKPEVNHQEQEPKRHQNEAYTTRSHSSDSLSSENSLDTGESNLSAEIKEKITKNDTLGRQKSNQTETVIDFYKTPRGLQALVLWNNNLTRSSAEYISDTLATTNSLELLNIGKNILSNDFIDSISNSLKQNRSLTNLGLQSSHLTSVSIKKLAEILQFGGNSTLQRIDIRDNNVQVEGLVALCDALKSNKVITRIDIDDEPKRLKDEGDAKFHYSKNVHAIRTLCLKNQAPLEIPAIRSSRKISLTCQSSHKPIMNMPTRNDNLDVKQKSGARLRSPLPSPSPSPSSSPIPSPSRASRFQVSRVKENGQSAARLDSTPSPDSARNSNCPSPTSRFHVTIVNTETEENKHLRRDARGITIEKESSSKPIATTNITNDSIEPTKNNTAAIKFIFPDIEISKEPINDTPATPLTPTQAPSAPNIPNTLDIVTPADTDPETKNKPKTETRVRKSSWNTNYPTVDRLLNLIQKPFRSHSNETDKKPDSDDTTTYTITNTFSSVDQIHLSKSQLFMDAATKLKDFGKHVLKQNMPAQQQSQSQPTLLSSAAIHGGDMTMTNTPTDISDTHDPNIKLQSKENISPKHSFSSNHSIPVHTEIDNADKILNLESQVVAIGEKVTNSETPLAKQDDDKHEK